MRDLGDVIRASKGDLAEQFVGQQLRCISPASEDPRLFYWQRTEGRQGKIDFIIQEGNRIIPIEVKAGSSGRMKSLHSFMLQKKLDIALHLDTNPPSIQNLVMKTTCGRKKSSRMTTRCVSCAGGSRQTDGCSCDPCIKPAWKLFPVARFITSRYSGVLHKHIDIFFIYSTFHFFLLTNYSGGGGIILTVFRATGPGGTAR